MNNENLIVTWKADVAVDPKLTSELKKRADAVLRKFDVSQVELPPQKPEALKVG